MAITKITYDCPTNSMGDTSEHDADGYRAWIKQQLAVEFPDVEITVTDAQSTNCISTDADADDFDALERLQASVQHAWDSCNWEWVK